MPRDDEPGRIEDRRALFEQRGGSQCVGLGDVEKQHLRRGYRVLRGDEQFAIGVDVLDIQRPDMNDALGWHDRNGLFCPFAKCRLENLEAWREIVEIGDDQLLVVPEKPLQGAARTRFEQNLKITLSGKKCLERNAEQRVCRVGDAGDCPVFSRLDRQPLVVGIPPGRCGHVHALPGATAIA